MRFLAAALSFGLALASCNGSDGGDPAAPRVAPVLDSADAVDTQTFAKPLEARVVIEANTDRYELLRPYYKDLPSFFIVSDVELTPVHHLPLKPDFSISVQRATGAKCERCWNYRSAVGTFPDHPTLCDRCVEAVR